MVLNQKTIDRLLVLTLGLLAAYIVNPLYFSLTNVDWLLDGDQAQSLIGWEFFRVSEFTEPITRIVNMFPNGTLSVIQTDSIPWLSLFGKMVAAIFLISEPFHLFGLWLVFNWVMQAVSASVFAETLQLSRIHKFALVFFFVFAPPFLFRTGHMALMAHWLILLPMNEVLRISKGQQPSAFKLFWLGSLAVFSIGIHPYWFALSAPIFLLALWLSKHQLIFRLTLTGFVALALIVVTRFLGFSAVKEPMSSDFGACNTDALGWLNSFGTSLFIPAIRSFWCQNEGYCYLGLSFVGLMIFLRNDLRSHLKQVWQLKQNRLIFGLLALYLIYSAASPVRFGGNPILYLPFYHWFEPLPSIFRSTGRWVWPVFYSLLIFTFALLNNKKMKYQKSILVVLCLCHFLEFLPLYNFYFTQNNVVNKTVNRIVHDITKPNQQSTKILSLAQCRFGGLWV